MATEAAHYTDRGLRERLERREIAPPCEHEDLLEGLYRVAFNLSRILDEGGADPDVQEWIARATRALRRVLDPTPGGEADDAPISRNQVLREVLRLEVQAGVRGEER